MRVNLKSVIARKVTKKQVGTEDLTFIDFVISRTDQNKWDLPDHYDVYYIFWN